jgi:hypothetical protein
MLPLNTNRTKQISQDNLDIEKISDFIDPKSDRYFSVEEQVLLLVAEARSHLPGSVKRQKTLTKIIRLMSNKLWREDTPYYQDALQQTWVYLCQNLCESNTGEAYNPSHGSVITWLNTYLKQRSQNLYLEQIQQADTGSANTHILELGQVNETSDQEYLKANHNISSLLEDLTTWVETDPKNELRCIYIEGHPEVTCQELLRRRLPPVTSWKNLAAEFDLPISTLSSFYQRHCIPRLGEFDAPK